MYGIFKDLARSCKHIKDLGKIFLTRGSLRIFSFGNKILDNNLKIVITEEDS